MVSHKHSLPLYHKTVLFLFVLTDRVLSSLEDSVTLL